jgi:transcription antitermination protein NusB
MANAKAIRRLAFQALFQIDARGVEDAREIREALKSEEGYTSQELDDAFALAVGAFDDRAEADAAMKELAPTWPAHRQAAVDRAILRLAHYEMTSGRVHPKVAVNAAVELAKEFSTDRSPAFVNGLLDKVLKRVLAQQAEPPAPDVQIQPGLDSAAGEPSSATE